MAAVETVATGPARQLARKGICVDALSGSVGGHHSTYAGGTLEITVTWTVVLGTSTYAGVGWARGDPMGYCDSFGGVVAEPARRARRSR
jgi:hypothetical protein